MGAGAHHDRKLSCRWILAQLACEVAATAVRKVVVQDEDVGLFRFEVCVQLFQAREPPALPAGVLRDLAHQSKRRRIVIDDVGEARTTNRTDARPARSWSAGAGV
jgi:hypothetical protein